MRDVLGRETGVTKGIYHFWCPHHGASAGRTVGYLGVHVDAGWFSCWKCEWKGRSLAPILRLGVDRQVVSFQDLEEYRSSATEHAAVQRQYETPALPAEFEPLTEARHGSQGGRSLEYLAGRGVTPELIARHRLGFCSSGPYRDRVIFPSFDAEGELNFMVGRSILPFDVEKFRYKHGEYDKDIVFNEYLIDWSRPVSLVEGPFDMLKAENSVPLLGTRLREGTALFRRLVRSGQPVYVALDSDARRAQLYLVRLFASHGVEARIVPFDGRKDVGEMSVGEYEERKKRARSVTDDAGLMRYRLSTMEF